MKILLVLLVISATVLVFTFLNPSMSSTVDAHDRASHVIDSLDEKGVNSFVASIESKSGDGEITIKFRSRLMTIMCKGNNVAGSAVGYPSTIIPQVEEGITHFRLSFSTDGSDGLDCTPSTGDFDADSIKYTKFAWQP